MRHLVCFAISLILLTVLSARAADHRAVLKSESLQATIQSGVLVELKDLRRGQVIVKVDVAQQPLRYPVFGGSAIDLSACSVEQQSAADSVTTTLTDEAKNQIVIRWTIESGDLVAQMSGKTAQPVEEMRLVLPGCQLADSLVWVDGYGVARPNRAPWSGNAVGNPLSDGCPGSFLHPLVALFEGDGAGWWIEGREERIGPAALMIQGNGDSATLGFCRRFPVVTTSPQLFEVRIRTWHDRWTTAVDPYTNWMEKTVGFTPIAKQKPEWVRDINLQAYIRVGDFATLETLATKVDPKRTLIGRMVGAWIHPMDYGYPDYTLNETAKKWIGRARELGFHVGVHFNTFGISKNRTDLFEQYKAGFLVTGKDADGKDVYQAVDGANRHIYTSPALKAWRERLIKEIKPSIDAGVDVVYLDESMAAMGNPYVDGMSAVEGVMTLQKEIKEAYPHVAIETEQFNPMNSRHSSFALSQMPLGHPLSGYIFHRFVNVVPEGVMGQPTDAQMMDAFQSWGFMLTNANSREDSWLKIAQAFQKYHLKPDVNLSRQSFSKYDGHLSHGLMPHDETDSSKEPTKLFGFSGDNGVTAFYEKQGTRRGLVVYEKDGEPRWIGTRVGGVKEWAGPGVLRDSVAGTEVMVDWLVYSGKTQLRLDPARTYALDESGSLDQDRFHVARVPDDFAFYSDSVKRIEAQYTGPKKQWFKLNFTGHGEMTLYVPSGMLVFLDGEEVKVDREKRSATLAVSADKEKPSTLLAFQPDTTELAGRFVDLPWHTPLEQRAWYVMRHVFDDVSADGPVRMIKEGNGFWAHVGGTAMMLGTLPGAKKIHVQGAFGMRTEAQFDAGTAVIRINGKPVLRLPGGERPYQVKSFDADVTQYAGKPVFIEFTVEGDVHGAAMADWFAPQIIVER